MKVYTSSELTEFKKESIKISIIRNCIKQLSIYLQFIFILHTGTYACQALMTFMRK